MHCIIEKKECRQKIKIAQLEIVLSHMEMKYIEVLLF